MNLMLHHNADKSHTLETLHFFITIRQLLFKITPTIHVVDLTCGRHDKLLILVFPDLVLFNLQYSYTGVTPFVSNSEK